MKFNYPLQKIVDIKHNLKSQAEWLLSQSMSQLKTEQSHLQQLNSERSSLQDELVSSTQVKVTISSLQAVQHYLNCVEQQIHIKFQEVASAEEVVTNRQMQLTHAMKDEKVWAKAKENAYEKFTIAMQKIAQNELDEIATNRFRNPAQGELG